MYHLLLFLENIGPAMELPDWLILVTGHLNIVTEVKKYYSMRTNHLQRLTRPATCDQHDSAGNLLGNMTQHLSSWHRDSALLVTVVVLVDLILRIRKCWREFYEGLHKIWKY